jgi:hypothetical protein
MTRLMTSLLALICVGTFAKANPFKYDFTGIACCGLNVVQSFEYIAPNDITSRTDLFVADLAFSNNVSNFGGQFPFYAVEFDPLDSRFGFVPNADVVRVGVSPYIGLFYYFPDTAFSTPGVYSTIGFASAGTLVVSSTPEPESFVLLMVVLGAIVFASRFLWFAPVPNRSRQSAAKERLTRIA